MKKSLVLLVSFLSFVGVILPTSQSQSQGTTTVQDLPRRVHIDVDAPERALYRIAVPTLMGESQGAQDGSAVLKNDFKLVSLFTVLDPRSFLPEPESLTFNPQSWSSIGAQGLIKGRITRSGANVSVELLLFETAKGNTPTLRKTYSGSPSEMRRWMHDFANEVLLILTGKRGAFGTQLLFARRMARGKKDVFVAGFDGHGISRISSGTGIAFFPSFSPRGVLYSVMGTRRTFITHSGTSDAPLIDSRDGINTGATTCGSRIYFSSTRDGNSEIYSSDLEGRDIKRLTNHRAIDVSPACGGPGGLVAFVSSRNGGPQVFVMGADGSNPRRVTFRGSYNQTPSWCPDASQQLLAFTGQTGTLDVYTLNIQTNAYTRITQGQGTNKDPAFSPDCRMLAFWSSRGGIYVSSFEGLNQNLVIPGHAETIRWSR